MATMGFSDYATEQGDIERRRKYAELLQQQAQEPLATNQMAGGWAVPISWTQGLAKGLQAYMGGKGIKDATAEQKALGQRARDESAAWAQGMPQARTENLNPVPNDDEGNPMPPAMKTTQPTQQEMMAWALRGASSGNPISSQMAGPFMAQALKMNDPYSLREGEIRVGAGNVPILENKKDFRPEAPKTPTPLAPGRTRDIQVGTEKVTQELQADGTWKEIGRGPQFARQVASVTNVHNAGAVTPVTIQDPTNPNATIIVDGRTGKKIGAGPKLTETGKANFKQATTMQGIGGDLQAAEDLLLGNVRDSEGNVTKGNLPTGSGVGSLLDSAAGLVGITPSGAGEADALKVVAGKLVQKVPRFEGPQSDKDVALYKQMAADAGNEKLPRDRRLKAVREMRSLYSGYEDGSRGALVQSQINSGSPAPAPTPAQVPTATGPNGQKLYLRNGQWVSK